MPPALPRRQRPARCAPHAGQVVRRALLRRNIVIDAETAQLVAAAVQAARPGLGPLSAAAPGARVLPRPIASRCSDHGSCRDRETRHPRITTRYWPFGRDVMDGSRLVSGSGYPAGVAVGCGTVVCRGA